MKIYNRSDWQYWFIIIFYNDFFRLFVVLGIPSILLGIVCNSGDIALYSYGLLWIVFLTFNDYSNLRKIGKNEYGKPLD